MRCLKSFGERIAARDPDRQTAEIRIRIALMNRVNALGAAEIVRSFAAFMTVSSSSAKPTAVGWLFQ